MTLPPEHADATYEIFNFPDSYQCIIASTDEVGATYMCKCGRKFIARTYHRLIAGWAIGEKDHFTWEVRWEFDYESGLTRHADEVQTLRTIYNQYFKTAPSVFDEMGNFTDVT